MFNFICRRTLFPHFRDSLRISPLSSISDSLSYSSKETSLTVNYLVNSCGLSPEQSILGSKRLNIKNPDKADSVLAFLKNRGFTKSQISDLVKKRPVTLLSNPEKTLLPKLEFLSSLGLSTTELARVITAFPGILGVNLENRIIPSYNFFRVFLGSDEKSVDVLKRFPWLLTCNPHVYVVQKIEILQQFGVPQSNIASSLSHKPTAFMRKNDNYRTIVEQVKEMGFNPLTVDFMHAVVTLGSISKSTWEKKMKLFTRWGWSKDDIIVSFGKCPRFVTISEDKFTRIMDFLINKIGLQSSFLVGRPKLLGLSFEKRIVPRCLLYQVLLDRGLIIKEKDFNFRIWLESTEEGFRTRIEKNYKEDAPELLKLYKAKLDSAKGRSLVYEGPRPRLACFWGKAPNTR